MRSGREVVKGAAEKSKNNPRKAPEPGGGCLSIVPGCLGGPRSGAKDKVRSASRAPGAAAKGG
jgi:hypothetical protein